MKTLTQERRRFVRSASPERLAINLLHPSSSVNPSSVNVSEGGLCFRLQNLVEVRSLVRLQLTSERAGLVGRLAAVECTGRVAWVIQRLDLRDHPPFLFDVGIEFVDPPLMVRQLLARHGGSLSRGKGPTIRQILWESALIRGRNFIPRLICEPHHAMRWHLVVLVSDVPCFSGHYPSERTARAAWTQFQRTQSKRSGARHDKN